MATRSIPEFLKPDRVGPDLSGRQGGAWARGADFFLARAARPPHPGFHDRRAMKMGRLHSVPGSTQLYSERERGRERERDRETETETEIETETETVTVTERRERERQRERQRELDLLHKITNLFTEHARARPSACPHARARAREWDRIKR